MKPWHQYSSLHTHHFPHHLNPDSDSNHHISPTMRYQRSNSAHHHSNGSNIRNSPDSQRSHHNKVWICCAIATYMATLEQPTLIVASNATL